MESSKEISQVLLYKNSGLKKLTRAKGAQNLGY